jgi:hypothetical protein
MSTELYEKHWNKMRNVFLKKYSPIDEKDIIKTEPWNYYFEQSNIGMTINTILAIPGVMDMSYVSASPSITLQNIIDHPELNWEYEYVSDNPNLTMQYIIDNLDIDWNWHEIYHNPFLYDKQRYINSLKQLDTKRIH